MSIVLSGLDYRTAPLTIRESVSMTKNHVVEALTAIKSTIGSGVILSTCNRMEIYTAADDAEEGLNRLKTFLEAQFPGISSEIGNYLYSKADGAAIEHLYRVSSSLESLIIGESEILGQVRDAFGLATEVGTVGGVLTKVFHGALRVGKRVRAETSIGRNALSVSRASVEMARTVLGNLRECDALIVGVGEASRLTGRAFRDVGVNRLVVTNRTLAHAMELAEDLDCEVIRFEEIEHLVSQVDLIVTSTGSPDFIIGRTVIERAMGLRNNRPLFIIDLAIPRDVDPHVSDIDGVHLYTMYDLEMIAESNRKSRDHEARKADSIVREEVAKFKLRWDARSIEQTVSSIRSTAEQIRKNELARTNKQLENLSDLDRKAIDLMSKAIVKKILDVPTRKLMKQRDEDLAYMAYELFQSDEAK